MTRFRRELITASLVTLLSAAAWNAAWAARVWLKDGRNLEGKLVPLSGLAEVPQAPDPDGVGPLQLIWGVNDELRFTFISKRQVQPTPPQADSTEIFERYRIHQQVAHTGFAIKSLGSFKAEPFDEYGRRIIRMQTDRGPEPIIQCITEITPLWTKVESKSHVWDMRVATSSINPQVLAKILARQTKQDDLQERRKLAAFWLQAERYELASRELERILADFPNDPQTRKLQPLLTRIEQLSARQKFDELQLRRQAGQHRLVMELLGKFPSQGVAGEILQRVREMGREYEALQAQYKRLLERFDTLLEKIDDEAIRQRIEPIRYEIFSELNVNTLDRLTAFDQLADDQSMLPEDRLSLAISGWLLGGDSATVKLPVALSAFEARKLVRRYLNAQDALSCAEILEKLRSQEAGTPAVVAKILAHMKPPVETPPADEPAAQGKPPATADAADATGEASGSPPEEADPPALAKPGYYELEVTGLADAPPVKYLVQLPPEYDPYRRYPAILTLHGAARTPELQVDWWAGGWTEGGWRNGQATRHGYIVIAPHWAGEHQRSYHYSLQEHTAVLNCLRDACRRFAVDTDRVFLSGHSMGGDAAWDIGLAHPDLWAGVIPIVAKSGKYCALYWQNAELVPFYFVCGELDGNKLATNARDLDRYLKRGYNTTVVEYIGRGHEHFSDEIHRLFDWMGRFRRNFYPADFTVSTMRYWDNFFWWVELADLPTMRTRAVQTQATLTATNGVNVRRTGAGRVTVWLSPEMISFDQPTIVTVEGRRISPLHRFVEPDLETLLEDARRRADRQHPFWAKLES